MTTSDEWVRERAELAWSDTNCRTRVDCDLRQKQYCGASFCSFGVETFAFALQEAIERGKAELAEAVAAERERLLDRLRNPDDALVEAVGTAIYNADGLWLDEDRPSRAALRVIAAEIDKP